MTLWMKNIFLPFLLNHKSYEQIHAAKQCKNNPILWMKDTNPEIKLHNMQRIILANTLHKIFCGL